MIIRVKHTGTSVPTIKQVVEEKLLKKILKRDVINIEKYYGVKYISETKSDGVTTLTVADTRITDVTLSIDVRTKKEKEELEIKKQEIIDEIGIISGGCSAIDKILDNITEMIKKLK